MPDRIRVAVLFGGRSAEHEISLVSARNIIGGLDPARYEVIPVAISKEGRWLSATAAAELLEDGASLPRLREASAKAVALFPEGSPGHWLQRAGERIAVDVVFPALHGPFGEDGSVQGLLRCLDTPCVGPGVLGSAVGMDKDVMKRLLRDAGLPMTKFTTLRQSTGTSRPLASWFAELGPVLYVKPANLGSSVGISRVENEAQLQKAIEHAFLFDSKIVIEEGATVREIEVAVLGNDDPQASLPGEIVPRSGWYSYEAKYLDKDGAELVIPAQLSPSQTAEARDLALRSFQALCLQGMSRVDLFLTEGGRWYVNEVNTIPGFTSISMYPKLWEASGLPLPALLDRLIALAMERHHRESVLKTSADG
ncbi:MAG: D-alanine--D-alanine ligase [Leptospirales bacterium]|nr:D-alanine--D-alanine ligase [Leptospirales bacterium]